MTLKIWLAFFLSIVVLASAACGSDSASGDPLRIALVTNNINGLKNIQGFQKGMADLGYVEGEDVEYIFADAPTPNDDLIAKFEELVGLDVNLIFTAGTPTGVAAYKGTMGTDIPVIFGVIADPIDAGVMQDLRRPGGNMTGVKLEVLQGKRLELLSRVSDDIHRVLVPHDPADLAATGAVEQASAVADGLGIELVLAEVADEAAMEALLGSFPDDVDAIFFVPNNLVNSHLGAILEIAEARRLPTSGPSTAQVEQGALMTYGFVHERAGEQAAHIADRVLRGVNPGDLPVENTESFLYINIGTADALGLAIPEDLLRQAEALVGRP